MAATKQVEFRVEGPSYRHWRVEVDGPIATLTIAVDEEAGCARATSSS